MLVRERLTGLKPPEYAQALVDLWRPWIEDRCERTLQRMEQVAQDQASFGRLMRDVLKALELSEELGEGQEEDDGAENEDLRATLEAFIAQCERRIAEIRARTGR